MNLSGDVVRKVVDYYKIDINDIFDKEIDLPKAFSLYKKLFKI